MIQARGSGSEEAFAVFFPAVTGFSQGVAMSGDLKTPSRSITRGTFAAVGLSTVVYLAAFVLLAGAAPAAVLVEETTTIMGDVSLASWTMLAGVLAATLSSGLRFDPRWTPRPAAPRSGPSTSPIGGVCRRCRVGEQSPGERTVVSAAIALATVAIGDLNAVAPIISMFFLASYGLINYATYYEIRAGSTGFRPRFRWYDQRASLAGTVLCAGAIVAINPLAGTLAALVLGGLYSYFA